MEAEIDGRFLQRLRNLIGRDCAYLGKECLVIEVLCDEGVVVLATREQLPPIQMDQYGQATSRSNELLQIPIFGDDRSSFSDEIMDLFESLNGRGKRLPPLPAKAVDEVSSGAEHK